MIQLRADEGDPTVKKVDLLDLALRLSGLLVRGGLR
jgi:hypothetical protein